MIIEASTLNPATPLRFLVLEGVNGAGKTTLQNSLVQYLAGRGIKSLATREPGATDLGKKLRPLILQAAAEKVTELSELFLFAADRADHVARVIRPAIQRGEIVICDRYLYSTIAFQGYGRGIDLKIVQRVNELAVGNTYPDLVFLLDLEGAAGISRNAKEGAGIVKDGDGFEAQDAGFHERIRNGFLQIARQRNEIFYLLDASKSKEEVFNQAKYVLDKFL